MGENYRTPHFLFQPKKCKIHVIIFSEISLKAKRICFFGDEPPRQVSLKAGCWDRLKACCSEDKDICKQRPLGIHGQQTPWK